jgi:hypothetical protein
MKFITIGEILLRLTPPDYGNIRMANSFQASYGGKRGEYSAGFGNSVCLIPCAYRVMPCRRSAKVL